jgi:transposase
MSATARAERDAAVAERDQALSQNDRLRHLLHQLRRAQFGRRSEKLDREQLLLALDDIEQVVAGDEAADDKKNPVAAQRRAEKRLRAGRTTTKSGSAASDTKPVSSPSHVSSCDSCSSSTGRRPSRSPRNNGHHCSRRETCAAAITGLGR